MPVVLVTLFVGALAFLVLALMNIKSGDWWKYLIGTFGCAILWALLNPNI